MNIFKRSAPAVGSPRWFSKRRPISGGPFTLMMLSHFVGRMMSVVGVNLLPKKGN